MVAPIGVGCGRAQHRATDQSKRHCEPATPASTRRIVVDLLNIWIVRGLILQILAVLTLILMRAGPVELRTERVIERRLTMGVIVWPSLGRVCTARLLIILILCVLLVRGARIRVRGGGWRPRIRLLIVAVFLTLRGMVDRPIDQSAGRT